MSSSYAQATNLDCFRVLIPVLTPRTAPDAIMDILNKKADEGVASSEFVHVMASETESRNGYPLFEAVQTAIMTRIPHLTTEQQAKDLPNTVMRFWDMLTEIERAEWGSLREMLGLSINTCSNLPKQHQRTTSQMNPPEKPPLRPEVMPLQSTERYSHHPLSLQRVQGLQVPIQSLARLKACDTEEPFLCV